MWSYASLAVIAVAGLVVNLAIAVKLGAEALGVFNQIYGVYVIGAQVAVMAIHDSIQKHVAEYGADARRCAVVSAAAIMQSLVTGSLVALVLFTASGWMGQILDSPATAKGIAYAVPGLALFSVNKVLLGILNGQRRMRAYAIGQGLRAALIVGVCMGVILQGMPAPYLGLSFSITEGLLFPFLFYIAAPRGAAWKRVGALRYWLKRHFSFSTRAFANGLLAEAYIRIDILMLGIFLPDDKVGIYSFAAMFVEGLFQVSVVVRTLANPILVGLLKRKVKSDLARFARRISVVSFVATTLTGAGLAVLFPYLEPYFEAEMVARSYPVLLVLCAGMIFFSAFVPLDHVLLQANRPGIQSMMMMANVSANIGFNLVLIPVLGMIGAAIATVCAFVVASVILNATAWRYLGLRGGVHIAK